MLKFKKFQFLKVCNATIVSENKTTLSGASNFNIFPNGIYKWSFAIFDAKEKPANFISFDFFFESKIHSKNFESSI